MSASLSKVMPRTILGQVNLQERQAVFSSGKSLSLNGAVALRAVPAPWL